MTDRGGTPHGADIGLEDAARLLMEMPDGSPIADLLVHCLLALRSPRERIPLDVLRTMTWLAPMLPGYTTSPVHARSLAHLRGVRADVLRTRDGWQTVAWRPDRLGQVGTVRVNAASEALALCAGTIA
ncbi:hypothetical protein ACFPYM_03120, partial [Methylobacterium hispanicum]